MRWELCELAQLGRIEIDLADAEVSRVLNRIHTWPLDWDVCRASCNLAVEGDPADQLISATSVVHNVPLVTRDSTAVRSKQIPLAGP